MYDILNLIDEVKFMDYKYICIDLKSFYASVECVERKMDPLKTNLVVADTSRTNKTICLAISPALKKYGLPGRARLFEVIKKVKEINSIRRKKNNNKKFISKTINLDDAKDLNKEIDFIIAPPRMKLYMDYSNRIYNIYLKYASCEDIFVYSIDEVFIDISTYLHTYKLSVNQLLTIIIQDIYDETGISATGGIGTNLYLAKVAMDIVAKHIEPNEYGVRIAKLNNISYRKLLWTHQPLTDFWRVGTGYANKLRENNIYTMGDIARMSINDEEFLFKLFGINAELLIDHAWGEETVSLKDIRKYKPKSNSLGSGQVLHQPYSYEKTKIIIKEMLDNLTLDLVKKGFVTKAIVLSVGYDIENTKFYIGQTKKDHYGRIVPKSAHGTVNLDRYSSSFMEILPQVMNLFEQIIDKNLTVRRINITAINIIPKQSIEKNKQIKQLSIFDNIEEDKIKKEQEEKDLKLSKIIINIKEKYGKNAILKGMDLEEGGTTIERNEQVGGHRA